MPEETSKKSSIQGHENAHLLNLPSPFFYPEVQGPAILTEEDFITP